MKFAPAGDRVLAVRVEEPEPLILVPDAAKQKGNRFRVVARGPGRPTVSFQSIAMVQHIRQVPVEPGEVVILDDRALTSELMLDGVEAVVFDSGSILGVVSE